MRQFSIVFILLVHSFLFHFIARYALRLLLYISPFNAPLFAAFNFYFPLSSLYKNNNNNHSKFRYWHLCKTSGKNTFKLWFELNHFQHCYSSNSKVRYWRRLFLCIWYWYDWQCYYSANDFKIGLDFWYSIYFSAESGYLSYHTKLVRLMQRSISVRAFVHLHRFSVGLFIVLYVLRPFIGTSSLHVSISNDVSFKNCIFLTFANTLLVRIRNCWRWSFDDDTLMMTTDAAQSLTIYFFNPYIEQHPIVSRWFARVLLHFFLNGLKKSVYLFPI